MKTVLTTVLASAALGTAAHAEILLSDFSNFALTGTYVDWDGGTFTSGADEYRVEATAFGGGWLEFANPIDASAESQIELMITVNPNNVTTGMNVVIFDGNGTQAGFAFDIQPGTQTLYADLNNPTFFNAGDLNSWDTSNIFNQWHIQGNFANGDALDISFDNLALVPAPSALALLGFAGAASLRRRR